MADPRRSTRPRSRPFFQWRYLSLSVGVLGWAIAGASKPLSFEEGRKAAQAAADTETGQRFDKALSNYFSAQPGVREAMSKCLHAHPGAHHEDGYFQFVLAEKYRLMIAPGGPFAECVQAAYEGRQPPPPPYLPFYSEFTFLYDDGDRTR